MSEDELERRRIYTQILEYEHDVVRITDDTNRNAFWRKNVNLQSQKRC